MAGCKVGPDFSHPATPLSNHWKHPQEAARILDSDLSGPWWSQFGDPVLDHLIHQAVAANPGLREASFRVLEARSRRAVVSGERFPKIDGKGSYAFKKISGNGSPFALTSQSNYDLYSAGFDSSWELDMWGKYSRSLDASNAEVGVAKSDYNYVLLTLLGDVAATYVELRTYQQRIVVAYKNLTIQQRTLGLAQARQRAGLSKPLDASQAKASLHATRARLPELEIGLQHAENRLCVLLGEPPRSLHETLGPREGWGSTQSIPTAPTELALGTPADLLRRRPDVRSAELQVATETAQIGVAVADLYPQLSLTGMISAESTEITDLFSAQSLAHNLGPSLTWNIFHFGRIRNRIAAQKARFGQSIWNYRTTVLSAAQEVEDALVSCVQERLRSDELTKAVEAANESIRLAELYYEQGLADFQSVLDSQRSLLALEDQLTVSTANLTLNRIALYKALGGGWESATCTVLAIPNPISVAEYGMIEHADPQPADSPVPSKTETLITADEITLP